MFAKVFASTAIVAAAVLGPLAVAPSALADDGCPAGVSGTICPATNDGIVATPPIVGGGVQNGAYGPAGDIPPVGRR